MNKERKMTVFISWSLATSRDIAMTLRDELDTFFNEQIEFWVSSVDITTGNPAINSIVAALQRSSLAIVCLDSSNYKKPWIYFETGAVFGQNYDPANDKKVAVLPIIFDNVKSDCFDGTPFKDIQRSRFTKDDFAIIVKSIHQRYSDLNGIAVLQERTFTRNFDNMWPRLRGKIDSIIKQSEADASNMLTADNVVEKLTRYRGFPLPEMGDVMRYNSGFETQEFYWFLLENVTKRLYIFGRKNRKLSQPEFTPSYVKLLDKNVDLRILFLNPTSAQAGGGVVQDISNFHNRLVISIQDFVNRYKDLNYNIADNCKMYSCKRESEIIVADEVIFYKDVAYSSDGKPMHFTNESFFVTSLNNKLGAKYFRCFEDAWNDSTSKTITESFSVG